MRVSCYSKKSSSVIATSACVYRAQLSPFIADRQNRLNMIARLQTRVYLGGPPPIFAGVKLGKVEVFLQKGTPDPKGCSVYFHVGDADALYEFHHSKGVEVGERLITTAMQATGSWRSDGRIAKCPVCS